MANGVRKALPIPHPNQHQPQQEHHEGEYCGKAFPVTVGRLGAEHAFLFRGAVRAPPRWGQNRGRTRYWTKSAVGVLADVRAPDRVVAVGVRDTEVQQPRCWSGIRAL